MSNQTTQKRVTNTQERPGWMSQFAHPRGFLGRLVGLLMAKKSAPMNRAAVEALDVQPADRVLEIGYGPGAAIALLVERAANGTVAGVDVSETMLNQASGRNRGAIGEGRVMLRQASAEDLPFDDGDFDKVVAINSLHLWPDRKAALAEIRRVLVDGGLLLVAARMEPQTPGKYKPPGLTEEGLETALVEIGAAGFTDVRAERRDAGRELVFISAMAPSGATTH